jgi:iron-sulfur cluster repair protein YtfE (RIC family)
MKTQNVDPSWTVNDVIAKCPETMPVLNAFGVDTCCGGDETLAAAALEAGLDTDRLVTALRDVIAVVASK